MTDEMGPDGEAQGARSPTSSPIIRYPTGWLLAVVDEPATAAEAARAVAATGIVPADLRVLTGADGRQAFRTLGASTSPLARIIRGVQFMSMDQMPDLPAYEKAIEEGRTVIAVHPGPPRAARREGRPGGPRRAFPGLLRTLHDRGVLALARYGARPAGLPPAMTADQVRPAVPGLSSAPAAHARAVRQGVGVLERQHGPAMAPGPGSSPRGGGRSSPRSPGTAWRGRG